MTTAAEAAQLTLDDRDGRARSMLIAFPTGEPSLSFLGPSGRVRALLQTTRDGAGLELAGADGHAGLHASVGSEGSAQLSLKDGNGTVAARLAATDGSGPHLDLADGNGMLRAQLGLRAWESPFLDLADDEGVVRAALGSVELRNPESNDEVRRPPSSLVLFDADGTALWKTPFKPRR